MIKPRTQTGQSSGVLPWYGIFLFHLKQGSVATMSLRCTSDSPPLPTVSTQRVLRRFLLALLALAVVMSTAPAIEAAPRKAKSHAKAKKAGAKSKPSPIRAAGKTKAEKEEEAAAGGKVAVLAFDGEDTYSVRGHVIKALTERGMKVEAGMPRLDTAEQYRDMGAVMNLAVYVQGHVKELPADHAVATIVVRSGVTGRKLTTATFTGYRRGLPEDVEEKLWERLGATFARACVEATKPRPHHNKPMVIEAGTPL
jgi:hypothetical protein